MATITVSVSDEEKEIIQKYADFTNSNVSDIVRDSVLEKIEDSMDLAAIREYESNQGKEKTVSFEEVVKELGFERELL